MARKDRAPTPPRRVQAPQQRRTAPNADAVRRQKMIVYAAAASGLVALAVVLVLIFAGGGSGGSDARTALEDAGCTVQIVTAITNKSDHSDVPTPTTKVNWNTDPPSNGRHYGQTIIFGAYNEPLQQQLLVHNYEHGGVGIQYGSDVPDATVQQLRDFYNEDPNGLILAPYPKLGKQIALTAWRDTTPGKGNKGEGVVAKCPSFDKGAFSAFLDAYGFQGPEPFPRDALQPGGN
jgi:hypothetical protein